MNWLHKSVDHKTLCLSFFTRPLLGIPQRSGGFFLWARCGGSCRMRFAYPTYRGGYFSRAPRVITLGSLPAATLLAGTRVEPWSKLLILPRMGRIFNSDSLSISGLLKEDGGGGRITQRCALRPSGRCLRQRSLAGLESNLGRSFSSFPAWAEYLIADSFENSGAFESDGGGGRIRTFEVDDGRFTVCSLWPLGNPTRGNSYCR